MFNNKVLVKCLIVTLGVASAGIVGSYKKFATTYASVDAVTKGISETKDEFNSEAVKIDKLKEKKKEFDELVDQYLKKKEVAEKLNLELTNLQKEMVLVLEKRRCVKLR